MRLHTLHISAVNQQWQRCIIYSEIIWKFSKIEIISFHIHITNYIVVSKIVVQSKSICRVMIFSLYDGKKDVSAKWLYDWKRDVIGILGKQKVWMKKLVLKTLYSSTNKEQMSFFWKLVVEKRLGTSLEI
jgi:hypothetical protein